MNEKLVSAAIAILAKDGENDEMFRVLFEESKQVTLSVIRRYTHATEEYEDILQETYIQVYKKIHTLQDPQKVQAWINRIAANIAIRTGMKQNSMMFSDLENEDGQIPDIEDESGDYNPEQIVEKSPGCFRGGKNLWHGKVNSKKQVSSLHLFRFLHLLHWHSMKMYMQHL